MTTYSVTTANWNTAGFWTAISEAGTGHTLDFSGLPSTYSVTVADDSNVITISDGTTSYSIGEDGNTSTDTNLGAPTLLSYFNLLTGSEGDDTIDGGAGGDTIAGGDGDDSIHGDTDGLYLADDATGYDLSAAEFTYATGANIGDLADGGTGHVADVNSSQVSDLMIYLDGDTTLEAGDIVDISFVDENGDIVIINNGVVGQSAYGDGTAGSGIFTVSGTDGDGNAIAVMAMFNENDGSAPDEILAGESFYDTDTDPLITNNTDVTLDAATAVSLDDSIDGGAGDDTLRGGTGDDTLLGGADDDVIYGRYGDDSMEGGTGNDTLDGGHDNDTLIGGDGSDYLSGDYGDDSVVGGIGDDTLQGSFGDDTLEGGTGADYLYGSYGVDSIEGGDGDDTIGAGRNDGDYVNAGSGSDSIFYESSMGDDTIYGGEGGTDEDTLGASAFLSSGATVTYSGDEEGTLVVSGDTLSFYEIEHQDLTKVADSVDATADSSGSGFLGNAGDDTIFAGSGADTIDGGADNDSLDGGGGADSIEGGSGDDTIAGDSGADTLTGGLGDDSLTGGAGFDDFVLTTSGGADTIADFDTADTDTDGFFNDQLDVSDLSGGTGVGGAVRAFDVVVTDDGSGNALLTFPEGETLLLEGVAPGQINTAPQLFAAGVPCFTPGILIATARGNVPAEEIRVGDLLQTADNGYQPVIWTGSRELSPEILASQPELRPILVRPGGLLTNDRPLLVSPQHRFLISRAQRDQGWLPELQNECFLRAKLMPDLPHSGARIAKGARRVRYIHFMTEAHQVIFAEGVATETFWPGPQALRGLDPAGRREMFKIFPDLRQSLLVLPAAQRSCLIASYGDLARPDLTRRDLRAEGNRPISTACLSA